MTAFTLHEVKIFIVFQFKFYWSRIALVINKPPNLKNCVWTSHDSNLISCTAIVGITNVCNHLVVNQSCVLTKGSMGPTVFCQGSECHLGSLYIKENILIILFCKCISFLHHILCKWALSILKSLMKKFHSILYQLGFHILQFFFKASISVGWSLVLGAWVVLYLSQFL